jgi:glucuronide carrier protein
MTWAHGADIVEYDESTTSIRAEGATYAVFPFTGKIGQAISAALFSYALAAGGCTADHGAEPQKAVDAICWAVGIMPAAFFRLAVAILESYPLTEAVYRSMVDHIPARRANAGTDSHAD